MFTFKPDLYMYFESCCFLMPHSLSFSNPHNPQTLMCGLQTTLVDTYLTSVAPLQ